MWSVSPKFGFADAVFNAISIAIVNFVEGISLGKKYAAEDHYSISVNQELIAAGLSNIVASFTQSSVVACGVSRSNVNKESGAKTPVSGLIAAILIAFALLFFTKLFYYTPLATLSAVIVAGSISIFDYSQFEFLWRTNRNDFWMAFVNFIITLILGVQTSVYIALILSLVHVLLTSSKARVLRLAYIPEELHSSDNAGKEPDVEVAHLLFRDIKVYHDGILPDKVLIVRVDNGLTAFNFSRFDDFIHLHFNLSERHDIFSPVSPSILAPTIESHSDQIEMQIESKESKDFVSSAVTNERDPNFLFDSLIIDCDRIISIDTTALFQLEELMLQLLNAKIKIRLANCRKILHDALSMTKIKAEDRMVYENVTKALAASLNLLDPNEVGPYLMKHYNREKQRKQLIRISHRYHNQF